MPSSWGPNGTLSDLKLLEWAVLGSGWMLGRVGVVRERKDVEGGWL